jgi:TonB family protein
MENSPMSDATSALIMALTTIEWTLSITFIGLCLLTSIGKNGFCITQDYPANISVKNNHQWSLGYTLIITLFCLSPNTHSSDRSQSAIVIYNNSVQCYQEYRNNQEWEHATQCAHDSQFYGNRLWPDDPLKKAQTLHDIGYSLMMWKGRSTTEGLTFLQQSFDLFAQSKEYNTAKLLPLLADITLAKILAGIDAHAEINLILNTVKKLKGPHSQAYAATALGLAYALGQQRSGDAQQTLNSAISLIDKSQPAMTFLGQGINHFVQGKIAINAGDTEAAKQHFYQAANHERFAAPSLTALVKLHDAENESNASAQCATRLAMIMPKREPQNLKPLFALTAEYPLRAKRDNISGYGLISLTVTPEGRVIDPVIVDENPRNKGFAQSTLNTATKLRYAPRIDDNGIPVATSGVIYKHYFQAPQS